MDKGGKELEKGPLFKAFKEKGISDEIANAMEEFFYSDNILESVQEKFVREGKIKVEVVDAIRVLGKRGAGKFLIAGDSGYSTGIISVMERDVTVKDRPYYKVTATISDLDFEKQTYKFELNYPTEILASGQEES